MEVCAYNPNSANDTIKLISDKWDFHWQGMYTFPKAVHIPKGYVLLARGIYDNTTANTSNPNSPPKDIVAGTSTLTEMMQVFFCYVPYVQGDEAMSFDTTGSVTTVVREASKESETFALWPNPCASGSELIMNLSKPAVFNATLFSSDGKALQNYTSLQGNDKTRIQLPELSKGVYILKLYNSTDVMTKKLLVQ